MVICLERGADLHMFQLMPLPLTVSCFSKIQIGFTFLVLAHLGSPGKGLLNGCVCVYLVCIMSFRIFMLLSSTAAVNHSQSLIFVVFFDCLYICMMYLGIFMSHCVTFTFDLCAVYLHTSKVNPESLIFVLFCNICFTVNLLSLIS